MTQAPRENAAGSGSSSQERIQFGEFEFDIDRGSLTCNGEEIALRPKTLAVLRYLLDHAGTLVTRQQLMDSVWPNVVVSDDSIDQCLLELRRALGDDDRTMIRTVPRRGLIFEVPVRIENPEEIPPILRPRRSHRFAWAITAMVTLVAALMLWWTNVRDPQTEQVENQSSQTRSIAVLRFADLSPGGDQAYLADGLSEEIIHVLAQSPSLRVIARASSFAVEGQSIAEITRQLDVSHVLEGSVRQQAHEIRVTAQLIDASTSIHLWSKTYDRDLDDLFEVQQEIALAVARSLEVSLDKVNVTEHVDPRAYQLYLEGRHFYLRRADGDLARARERYEQAVAISPEFARAWTGLAAVAAVLWHEGFVRAESDPTKRERLLEVHEQAVQKALKYGPGLPEAHIRAARYYQLRGDRERARRHVEIAYSLDPDHWLVRSTLSNELGWAGRIDRSVSLLRRGVQQDPLNMVQRFNLIGILVWAGWFDEARSELDTALEISPEILGQSAVPIRNLSILQILEGDFQAAASLAESLVEESERLSLLTMAYHGLGHQADADEALRRLAETAKDDWGFLRLAEAYAQLGESSQALQWLRRIDLGEGCDQTGLSQFIYYSPFLAGMDEQPGWETYRSGVLQVMRSCLLDVNIDFREI